MVWSLLFCVVPLSVIGFLYSWVRLTPNTRRQIAAIKNDPIYATDKAGRVAKAAAIGEMEGFRLGASEFTAVIGAGVGLALWVIWEVVQLVI